MTEWNKKTYDLLKKQARRCKVDAIRMIRINAFESAISDIKSAKEYEDRAFKMLVGKN